MQTKYPWLDDSNERRHMTDKEILDKYIYLEGSCLTKWKKQKLRNIIYDYKDVFSPRDQIGTCLNIKVGNRHYRQLAITKSNQDYEVVLNRLYLHYDMKLVMFGIDYQKNLIIQFPVFVQPYTQNQINFVPG